MLSYWAFSDVFEEQGVVKQPFYGGFGLLAEDGLPKPAFNAFKLLHRLGDQRLESNSGSALVTTRTDGTLVIAAWNLFLPEDAGKPKVVTLELRGKSKHDRALIYRLDSTHGSLLAAYQAMGSSRYPTSHQIEELRSAAKIPAPESAEFTNGELTVRLPPQGLALIEIR
jgi:xylan 1,4-beta-xylosidase